METGTENRRSTEWCVCVPEHSRNSARGCVQTVMGTVTGGNRLTASAEMHFGWQAAEEWYIRH
jgi:hypothetical protein